MIDLDRLLDREASPDEGDCGCRITLDGTTLAIDADGCPHGGALESEPGCRRRAVVALDGRRLEAITVSRSGRERTYRRRGPGLFAAASAFAAAVEPRDDRLAEVARRDPLAAAHEVAGRAGPVRDVAVETGLATFGDQAGGYADLLDPTVGLSWSHWRVAPTPPLGARLAGMRELDTGGTVRIYVAPDRRTRIYHLELASLRFDEDATATLERAHERLAVDPGGGPRDAVGAAADPSQPVTAMARTLRSHTRECGLLRDCFADPALSDVFVTAPATRNPLRVRADGETFETNVFLTEAGVGALASRFRRESGRGFSRATPTLQASTTLGGRRVRVAGVTEPVSEGEAFAFRAHDRDVWRLPALVGNDTLPPLAAGLLSLAVDRGAAMLLAGPRGSGKTTMLGALLWELPEPVRTVCLEDAPELPVAALQEAGRDVQGLRTDGPLGPAEALRSALRLGDGALVVGEVRGEEAAVLYEAMRVGANSEAVLGTIHGDGAADVLERVVSDLGVPASSFATTDLVVTLETVGRSGATRRRVRTIEEVHGGEPVEFAPLFERRGDGLVPTGRIDRGNSRLVAGLTPPDDTYGGTRAAIQRRAERLGDLAAAGDPVRPR